jgi:hypothetical protein
VLPDVHTYVPAVKRPAFGWSEVQQKKKGFSGERNKIFFKKFPESLKNFDFEDMHGAKTKKQSSTTQQLE